MNMPTREEFSAAIEEYLHERPLPVAAAIDASADMTNTWMHVFFNLKATPFHQVEDYYDAAKALVVLGLNIGIRIGEARVPMASKGRVGGASFT